MSSSFFVCSTIIANKKEEMLFFAYSVVFSVSSVIKISYCYFRFKLLVLISDFSWVIKVLHYAPFYLITICNHSFWCFYINRCKSAAMRFLSKHKVPGNPWKWRVSRHLLAIGYYSHSLLGIIFNGFCFINLIPHFFDYLMCPYYPALYDGLLSNCYRWW